MSVDIKCFYILCTFEQCIFIKMYRKLRATWFNGGPGIPLQVSNYKANMFMGLPQHNDQSIVVKLYIPVTTVIDLIEDDRLYWVRQHEAYRFRGDIAQGDIPGLELQVGDEYMGEKTAC
jgi:hypothetical protein